MTLALLGWLACTIVGLILIDLDLGPRLVSLTMGHGISLTDAVAGSVLLAGWLGAVLTARRRPVTRRIPTPGRWLSAAAALAACVGLVTTGLLMPDYAGRKLIVAGFALLLECSAAATLLAWRAGGDRG